MAIGGLALALGFGIGYANIKFKVEEDPRLEKILEVLPGANCGACGFPGCGNFATSLLSGKAKPESCPIGGFEVVAAIGAILGVTVEQTARKVAYIRCEGGKNNSTYQYQYLGMDNCSAAMQLAGGGAKACSYGCLGGGSCMHVCDFDAVVMKNGIAVIDEEKCVACEKCVSACPKNIVEIVPYDIKVRVACKSLDNGKTVRANCTVGCIGCKLCEKNCTYDAVHVTNLLADIDYEKCTQCWDCVGKCPTKCIAVVGAAHEKEVIA